MKDNEKPVLVQVNVCNNVYSTGKIVAAIGDMVTKSGWNSYIAYARSYKPSLSSPCKIGNWMDWNLNALEQRLFDNTGFGCGSYYTTKAFVKRLQEIKPDIIHLHNLVGYYLNYNVLFQYLSTLNIPIVWTLHSCWEITGHCTHFDYVNCDKWKTECYECPLKREYPQSYLFDHSRQNYRQKKRLFNSPRKLHIVAVSKWLKGIISESFLKDQPISVIYNGIDIRTFCRHEQDNKLKQKFGLSNKFIALCAASSWIPKKGFKDYLELSALLPSEMIIVMVGVNEKQIKELPSNIIGITKTTDVSQMREFYSMSDVVLNLSYEESFGLTTVEGMACGIPSIVYNKTASPELISEDTGYVVNAGDLNSVVVCMKKIRDMGKEYFLKPCRERAEILFDKDKNFLEYIKLYNRLLMR